MNPADPSADQNNSDQDKPDQHSAERAHMDFTRALSYGDYLQLDTLKAAHRPVTGVHDEHLFIAVHHVSEVWLELIVRESKRLSPTA